MKPSTIEEVTIDAPFSETVAEPEGADIQLAAIERAVGEGNMEKLGDYRRLFALANATEIAS